MSSRYVNLTRQALWPAADAMRFQKVLDESGYGRRSWDLDLFDRMLHHQGRTGHVAGVKLLVSWVALPATTIYFFVPWSKKKQTKNNKYYANPRLKH